jgi:hypothetical protein
MLIDVTPDADPILFRAQLFFLRSRSPEQASR